MNLRERRLGRNVPITFVNFKISIHSGPGHCHFDFGQEISFLKPSRKPAANQLNTAT